MAIKDALLPEFDHEMQLTRKVLARVPEDKFGWKPHDKSMTLGRLAGHLAEIPGWVKESLTQDSLDMGGEHTPDLPTTREQVLAKFDKMVAVARPLIDAATDSQFMSPWTLKNKGQDLFTLPKIAVIRSWVLNHAIHHRGQMSVYLRLNNVPVPSIYGPSADEAS
jgi:uncharacterized damage-inducible protein DinB